MELLDRYLKTVGTYLPKSQRADILRELSENIRSQIEDRETELGRPLNEAEQEALLKQVGNPLVVAGRFQKDQRTVAFGRQLIGPALFPLVRQGPLRQSGSHAGHLRNGCRWFWPIWANR